MLPRRRTSGQGCATKLLWMRVQGGVMEALAGTTLAELVAFSDRTARAGARRRLTLPDTKDYERHMAELEIRNLHVPAGDKQILKGLDLTVSRRGARAHGPQRLGQVHAGQRDHGPPEARGHRGDDPLRRPGHHRGRARRAAAPGPVHGLPVPRRHPGRDHHQVPAHGHERPPRGAGRGRDLAQGLPQDRRGRDGAHERAEGVLLAATSTRASPAARRSAWRSSSSRCSARRSPCSTRPTRAWTSTR